MKARITIFITLIAAFLLFASRNMITWEDWYNTEHGDALYSIKQTADSGYIAGGYYTYQIDQDWYTPHARLIRLDKYGEVLWESYYAWSEIAIADIKSVIEDSDGNFVTTGIDIGSISILKFDKDGNLLWNKYYGRGDSEGYDIKESPDGGYVVAGLERGRATNPLLYHPMTTT
ncbi:MAG: hypothetical protein PF638_16270 [Candidatus Delongbacteria bacterium]|nr:hypothetical protein [Candidatus Delongbacteria bacterium]